MHLSLGPVSGITLTQCPIPYSSSNASDGNTYRGTGTGGTIAGTGNFLKTVHDGIVIALADPEGSGLYNKVKFGVMYHQKESEGTKRRHQVDTVVEGM